VVLRTYADAFEWDVVGGDVAKAITTGKPRITPLPNEPQGESITYSRDGRYFITASDLPAGRPAALLRYTPAAPAAAATGKTNGGGDAPSGGRLSNLTLNDITVAVAGVGVLGLILVIVGLLGIRRSRRRRRNAEAPGPVSARAAVAASGGLDPAAPGGGFTEVAPAGGKPTGRATVGGTGVYGSARTTAGGSSDRPRPYPERPSAGWVQDRDDDGRIGR
jgi:hypothetical protein